VNICLFLQEKNVFFLFFFFKYFKING
jgi:hypothetical protein